MKHLDSNKAGFLQQSLEYSANTPLWQRVPTRDESGKYLIDFMMVFPGLKKTSSEKRKQTLNTITQILSEYADIVVFADLNLKMSLLWVSLKPKRGMIIEIPAAIMKQIPEAKIISDRSGLSGKNI